MSRPRLEVSKNGYIRTDSPVTCQGCGKSYMPRQATFGKFCSVACMRNRVTKQCPQCKKSFSVTVSKAQKYNFCSLECKEASRPTIFCQQCGKAFQVNPARRNSAKYCSNECRKAAHPLTVATITCAYCGCEKVVEKYRIVGNWCKCCSNRCAVLLRMRDGFWPGSFGEKRRTGYHTDIETMTEQVLIALNIPFIFEHKIHRYSVDFALPTLGIALECDGWQHLTERGRERDKVRDEALTNEGWEVIHMPDAAIRTDAHAAVVTALKDHL